MFSDKGLMLVGGLGAVAILALVWSGRQGVKAAADAVGGAAGAVNDFVANENVFSETADNAVNVVSGGSFRDLGDVLMWITGTDRKVNEALAPVPLPVPSTAKQ